MEHPNPKKHLQLSLLKSAFRMVGYLFLLSNPLFAVLLLIISEVFGIWEEKV